jgi:hypothetical protein
MGTNTMFVFEEANPLFLGAILALIEPLSFLNDSAWSDSFTLWF